MEAPEPPAVKPSAARASNATEATDQDVSDGLVAEEHPLKGSLDRPDGHDALDMAGSDKIEAEDKQPEDNPDRSKVANTNADGLDAPAAMDISGVASEGAMADQQVGGVPAMSWGTEAAAGVLVPPLHADGTIATGTLAGASPRSPPFGAATQAAADGECLQQLALLEDCEVAYETAGHNLLATAPRKPAVWPDRSIVLQKGCF